MSSLPSRIGMALVGAVLIVSCATSRLYRDGQHDFEQGRYEVGLQEMEQALAHDPGNVVYKAGLKARREEVVQRFIANGDRARAAGNADLAEASYKQVLAIDSGNDRATKSLEAVAADRRHAQLVAQAQQEMQHGDLDQAETHLRSVLAEDPGFESATLLRAKLDSARGPMMVTPRLHTRDNHPVTLQFRDASTKMVFEVLSRQTGINFIFDKDVHSDSKTTIFVQDVPIDQAIDLVIGQNQLARQVLSDNMVLIYPNTSAKQKDYQDQIVKTFYLTSAAPKDVESLLKTVLEAKTLVINERANAVVMRDTPENVRMAEKLVDAVDLAEPEVMLEVEVLEITRTRMQQLGITYPGSLTLTATSPAGAAGLVLNDLRHQTSSTIAVSPLSMTIDALKQTGFTNELASPRIRARNKEKAKILIGSREPVISTAASASGNGGIVSNTNVQYLDVGLTLEVEPTIYANNDVAIKMNLEVSAITKQLTVPTGSGGSTIAYEIGTRNATTLLQLRDGETQILAGLIRDTDSDSASSIPGLGDIPVVGRLFGSHNSNKEKTEIVLSITPRIIRARSRPSSDTTEFWYGTETRSGVAPLGSVSMNASHALGAAAAPGGAPPVAAAVSRSPVNVSTLDAAATEGAAATAAPPAAISSPAAAPAQHVAQQGPVPHPTLTLDGRGDVRVGDEFTVKVSMQSDDNVNHLRAQVRFDASTLKLLNSEAGDLVPSSITAKITTPPGGVQFDVAAPGDAPLRGSGGLMVLNFKALRARPTTAIAAQLAVLGPDGASIGSNTPTPLTFAVTN